MKRAITKDKYNKKTYRKKTLAAKSAYNRWIKNIATTKQLPFSIAKDITAMANTIESCKTCGYEDCHDYCYDCDSMLCVNCTVFCTQCYIKNNRDYEYDYYKDALRVDIWK